MAKKMTKNSKTSNANACNGESEKNAGNFKKTDAQFNRHTDQISGRPYFEVAKSLNDDKEIILTDAQKKLLEVQGNAIDLLLKAYNSMIELAAVRLQCKLSNTRVTGVARELKELIKVMSVYDC